MIYRAPTSTEGSVLTHRYGTIPFEAAAKRDHERFARGVRGDEALGTVLLHGDKLTAAHIETGTCCFLCAQQVDDPNMIL